MHIKGSNENVKMMSFNENLLIANWFTLRSWRKKNAKFRPSTKAENEIHTRLDVCDLDINKKLGIKRCKQWQREKVERESLKYPLTFWCQVIPRDLHQKSHKISFVTILAVHIRSKLVQKIFLGIFFAHFHLQIKICNTLDCHKGRGNRLIEGCVNISGNSKEPAFDCQKYQIFYINFVSWKCLNFTHLTWIETRQNRQPLVS